MANFYSNETRIVENASLCSVEWTLDPPDGLTRRDIYVNSEQFRNQKTYQDQTWDGLLKEIILTWFWILLAWAMLFATFYVISKMMQAL